MHCLYLYVYVCAVVSFICFMFIVLCLMHVATLIKANTSMQCNASKIHSCCMVPIIGADFRGAISTTASRETGFRVLVGAMNQKN